MAVIRFVNHSHDGQLKLQPRHTEPIRVALYLDTCETISAITSVFSNIKLIEKQRKLPLLCCELAKYCKIEGKRWGVNR